MGLSDKRLDEIYEKLDGKDSKHARWKCAYFEDYGRYFKLVVRCTNCGHLAYADSSYVKNGEPCPTCGV